MSNRMLACFFLIFLSVHFTAFAYSTVAALPKQAEELESHEWHKEPVYMDRAMGKLVFGSINLLLGWTELFTEPYEAAGVGDNIFWGIGKGIFNFAGDTAGGALTILTFPFTTLKIPLPEGGVETQEF